MKLHVLPRKTMTKEEFISTWPHARVIALDGFVPSPPFRHITSKGYAINFDHHTGGERLSMRSTSGQVLMALKLGLGSLLDNAGVFVNDCDQDVCLATWLLKHPHRVVETSEPLLNRLIWAEDVLDVTGGGYPFPASSNLRAMLHWIFAPYEENRRHIPSMEAPAMEAVIEAVWHRIDDYLIGSARAASAPDTATASSFMLYELPHGPAVRQTTGVTMVREFGAGARQAMSRAGIRSFIAVEPLADEKWSYKVGTLAPFTYFPLLKLYDALNAKEALKYVERGQPWSASQGWGGSDVIGGGPRSGSLLSPQEVQDILVRVMEDN